MKAAEEQRDPDRFSPVPEAGNNNNKVIKLRVDNGDTKMVMNNEFKNQTDKNQEYEQNRVGTVKRLPPGSTHVTFLQNRTSLVTAFSE